MLENSQKIWKKLHRRKMELHNMILKFQVSVSSQLPLQLGLQLLSDAMSSCGIIQQCEAAPGFEAEVA